MSKEEVLLNLVKEIREELKFYANEYNYCKEVRYEDMSREEYPSSIDEDDGSVARNLIVKIDEVLGE